MPIHFSTDWSAKQEGWALNSPIIEHPDAESNARFCTLGEREMGCLTSFFQTIFVIFLCVVTCDYALQNDTIRMWHEEVQQGKIFETLLLGEIIGDGTWDDNSSGTRLID